jgi:hypothetical protein
VVGFIKAATIDNKNAVYIISALNDLLNTGLWTKATALDIVGVLASLAKQITDSGL